MILDEQDMRWLAAFRKLRAIDPQAAEALLVLGERMAKWAEARDNYSKAVTQ